MGAAAVAASTWPAVHTKSVLLIVRLAPTRQEATWKAVLLTCRQHAGKCDLIDDEEDGYMGEAVCKGTM